MANKGNISVNFEYGALRIACALVNAIPYSVASVIARMLSFFAFDILRIKHARTMMRLREVFPDKKPRELRRIARASLANVLMTTVEMIRAPRLDRRWIDRHFVGASDYAQRLKNLLDEGHGVVIMVPHSGNWYMAAWGMAKYDLRLSAIAARQRNPKIDAWMKRQYGDIEVVERGSASTLVDIKCRLQAGSAFAILPDLRVPRPDVEVDFLGGKANVSHAGAQFAVHCSSPIVVAAMRREHGRHVCNWLATLRPQPDASDSRAEAVRLTCEVMRLLDQEICRYPEAWFWYNKRWILQPVRH